MAAIGVKSNMPILGIIRRRGDRIGSVIRYRMIVSLFVGLGENQDRIARNTIAQVSTSHTTLIKLNRKVTVPNSLIFWLYYRQLSPLA